MRALLPPGTRLESVTMLGGREAVTKACELDQTSTNRKKLYIVDGDFDFLLGRRPKKLKYFYRLRANNIENLLMDEDCLVAVGLEQQPRKPERVLRNEFAFQQLINDLNANLTPLFVAYAATFKLDSTIQTTGFPVRKLITNTPQGPHIDPIKVRRRVVSLYLKLSKSVGVEKVRKERSRISKNAAKNTIERIVSGKDYILPIVFLRFQAIFGYGRGDEHFKVALARSFSPLADPYFARKVRSLQA